MINTVRKRAAQISATFLLTGILVALPGADAAFAAAPTISSFSPTSGPVGTSVTIHGQNFKGPDVTSVTFNGTSATFTIDKRGEQGRVRRGTLGYGARADRVS